ncbi:MAG: amidohydrolase [Actinomycetota bacterium]|nr:amidohydrolase [Actinomycetota bacterium]
MTARPSLLIENAAVITMDPARRVISPGYVAIADDRITGVGPMAERPDAGSARVIDATGHAVLPGFVNAHTHSLDLLLRGGLCDDRRLYDWLANVVLPGCKVYGDAEIETAVGMYTLEALRSGITTVVDSVEVPFDEWLPTAELMTRAYGRSGLRTVLAQMFYDQMPAHLAELLAGISSRPPTEDVDLGAVADLGAILGRLDEVIGRYHGTLDGRLSMWPSPGVAVLCSRDALIGARDLARRRGTMTTLHLAESPHDERQCGLSSVEYLGHIGFLGPDVLAAHCVQTGTGDVRVLAETGTRVATNPVSNLFLGNGIAPVAELLAAGVKVGIGTDDANCNGTVNMVGDLKFAALAQKGRYRDPAALTAERALEMATIGGAEAIGMAEHIGSVEVAKKADLAIMDLRGSHLFPRQSLASAIVYQATGDEVDTVIVDGRIVMEGRRPVWLDAEEERELVARAQACSDRVAREARLPARSDAAWRSTYAGAPAQPGAITQPEPG